MYRRGIAQQKILKLLKDKVKTKRQLSKNLQRTVDTVTDHLLILKKNNYVTDVGKIKNKTKIWQITNEGRKLMEAKSNERSL